MGADGRPDGSLAQSPSVRPDAMIVTPIKGRTGEPIATHDGILFLFDRRAPQPEIGTPVEIMISHAPPHRYRPGYWALSEADKGKPENRPTIPCLIVRAGHPGRLPRVSPGLRVLRFDVLDHGFGRGPLARLGAAPSWDLSRMAHARPHAGHPGRERQPGKRVATAAPAPHARSRLRRRGRRPGRAATHLRRPEP